MARSPFKKRSKTLNTKPTSIRQLQKATRKGHVPLPEASRLAKLRYGRTKEDE